MSVDVTVETLIHRPVAEVSAYAGDPSNAPEWYSRISSAQWVTQPPVVLGSQITFRADFLGKALVYTYEVVELVPERRLVMSTSQGPFPMTTTYTWEPVGSPEDPLDQGSTRMTLRNHGIPSGFSRIGAPMMALAMRRAMTADLRALTSLLES